MATSHVVLDLPGVAAADYSTTGQHRICKLNTSNGRVTLCSTAGERAFGVLQDDPTAAGKACSLRVLGTTKVYAGDTITRFDPITTDANGAAIPMTKNYHNQIGIALGAASSGEVFEMFVTAMLAGGDITRRKGFIQLPLSAARELGTNEIPALANHGGILAKDSTPNLEAINAGTDQQLQLEWAASNSDPICWDVAVPDDLDEASDVTFHCFAKSGGSTDTPTIGIAAYQGVGDTDFGGATAALSATLAEKTRTLAAADVATAPSNLVIIVTPGAHTTDTVVIQGACWLEYTKK